MNINDIFTIEQYDEAYEFVMTHEYTHIEDLGNGQYQLIQDHIPTEEEKAKEEAERIAMLHITKADMERALVRVFYITFNDILEKAKIEQPDTWKFVEAELNAGWIYRGNDYVIAFANKLGITPEQLDNFFIAATSEDQETKMNAWKILVPPAPPEVVPETGEDKASEVVVEEVK